MKFSKKFKLQLMLLSVIILLGNSFYINGSLRTSSTNLLYDYPLGDNQYLESVAISSDGFYIAATCYTVDSMHSIENAKVYLFNNSLPQLDNPTWNYLTSNSLYNVDISANGSSIAVGGGDDDRNVYFFDYLNPVPEWNYPTGGWVYDTWNSDDGNYIAAASGANEVFLFNKTGSSPFWEASTDGLALRVEASSNVDYIVVTDNAHKLYLFNKSSSLPEWTFSFSLDMSTALSMSDDGNYFVSGGEAIYLFNKNSSTPIWTYSTSDYVRSVRITPDGNYIVAGCWNNRVYFFSRLTSTPLWSYQTGGEIAAVDISDNGEYIVAQSDDNYVYLFNNASSNPVWSYRLDGVDTGDYDYELGISSDGKFIVAGGRHYIYVFGHDLEIPLRTLLPGYNLVVVIGITSIFTIVIIYRKRTRK